MDLTVPPRRPVLAVTVDGHWHALDPDSGAHLWTVGPLDGRPLLNTSNAGDQGGRRDALYTPPQPVYLVEPVGDGALFAYLPGESVHRLPLTIRMLVEQSPGRLADGTLHVGSVHNSYYALDVATGGVVGTFGTNTRPSSGLGGRLPATCVLVGKTEFKVAVFQQDFDRPPSFSAKLSVFPCAPSEHAARDHEDLARQLGDAEYHSSSNGILYKKNGSQVQWIHKFLHPVLYVFQTVTVDGRLEAVPIAMASSVSKDLVHVGMLPEPHSESVGLYVLDGRLFPNYKPLRRRQVAQSELAIVQSDEHLRFDAAGCVPGSSIYPGCLVGPRQALQPYHVPLLEGPSAAASRHPISDALLYLTTSLVVLVSIVLSIVLAARSKKQQAHGNAEQQPTKMAIFEQEAIGHGSQGTVVLRGTFEGRQIAVKRMLCDYFDIAQREVELLQHSDAHPNVVRYYCMEQRGPFIFIGLELCPASLIDLVERPLSCAAVQSLLPHLTPKEVLRQATLGLQHLHQLGIVHRDLKPGNILISPANPRPRVLLSDFGLSRRLDPGQSHFQPTLLSGTVGWRAPECILDELSREAADSGVRMTKKVDIFALGCVFHYVLTGGGHPFGDSPHERESNISKHCTYCNVEQQKDPEAADLIERLLAFAPQDRPDCQSILGHPFFWPAEKKLAFLADVSDRLERGSRKDPVARAIESRSYAVCSDSWHRSVDRALFDDLGKYRKYFASSIQDLLRAMRNKRNHFQELPEHVKDLVGDTPEAFYRYFSTRFPRLLVSVYKAVEGGEWRGENPFRDVYL